MSGKLRGIVTLPHHPRPGMATLPQFVAINKCLQQLRDRMTPPQRNRPNKDTNTLPPFWPTLATDDGGSTFTFTITDGLVVDHHGGNGNTDALSISYPTGIGTFGGERTAVAITEDYQISIKVVTDKEGDITAVSLEVTAEDIASTNPDPTTSAGTGTGGTFYYKIAVLRSAAGAVPAYLDYYLAGSHIAFRHRGHNLNHKIHVVTINSVTHLLSETSWHTLVWRNGDYVGKFASGDTLPGYVGALDTDDSTYLT